MDDVESLAVLLLAYGGNKLRDLDINGATVDAKRALAVEATVGLCQCHFFSEPLVNGTEVLRALSCVLFVSRSAG